jgi:uncharacterized GH25 family protein
MRLHIGISVLLAAVLLAAPAFATGQPFSLSGQVLDRYDNPVSDATVTLMDNNFNVINTTQTADNGNYDFINALSNTDAVTVRVSLTRDGKTHQIPSYYARWRQ